MVYELGSYFVGYQRWSENKQELLFIGVPSFYFVSNILSGNNVIMSVVLILLEIPII